MKKQTNHLLIVSWAFIFIGFLAIIRTVDSLMHSTRPTIDFLIIFALVGYGLLRHNALARSFAIACCWVTLIFQIAAIALVLTGKRTAGADGSTSQILFWLTAVFVVVASIYALWALQNRSVRALFR